MHHLYCPPAASRMVRESVFVLGYEVTPLRSPGDLRVRWQGVTSSGSEGEVRNVFRTLYNTWCHDPVSTIALCMIAHSYQQASDVIHALGSFEMTEIVLSELDKLVQLLESPVFSALRLELVQPNTNPELYRSLAGILMLLPQSEAFTLLRNRLECVGVVRAAEQASSSGQHKEDDGKVDREMLDHFNSVQTIHQQRGLLSKSVG
eukprot:sb/3470456/